MILSKFPCRIGTPNQKVCHTLEDALERINTHNGVTDVYATLYNGDNVVDKIVWDFDITDEDDDKYDSWEEAIADFRKLSERFDDEGYEHMSVFSGGGLHKYLKARELSLQNPRDALRDAQLKFQNELELQSDSAIFGDIERIFRVPNTWHVGKQRYCVPLRPEEIYLDHDELVELAQEQRFDIDPISPGESYPIHKHDSGGTSFSPLETGDKIDGDFNPAEIEPTEVVFPIYPCISNLLLNRGKIDTRGHGLGFRRRFLIILHLKETGHSYKECIQILKKYLSSEEFYHCVYKEKQPRQIYKRSDLIFPECERLMTEIPCIHDPPENPCESKDSIYI